MILLDEIKAIKNILTLRYNPEIAPGVPLKNIDDFTPLYSDPQGHIIEQRLLENLSFLKDSKRVGIALSSGVDSSLVLAMIREINPDISIEAFHYSSSNHAELIDTKQLAQKYNCNLHIIAIDSVFDYIPFMVKMLEEPKWDAYDYLVYQVAKAHNLDLMLTGDGADELFGGYTFRYDSFMQQYNSVNESYFKTHNNEFIALYLQHHKNDFVVDQEDIFVEKLWFTRDIDPYFEKIFKSNLHPLNKVFLADYNGKLAFNFSVKKNKFAKHFVPIYSPFLEDNISNFATHLKPDEKYSKMIGKLHLREICKRYNLSPPLKKMGFTHNIKEDWNKNKERILDYLLDSNRMIYKRKIIDYSWLLKNKDSQEERVINKLVSLYTVEEYLKWLM